MRELFFTVPPEYDGIKVQNFLRGKCGISYRLLVTLKHTEDGITANGKHIRSIDSLNSGDVLRLRLPEDKNPAQACELPLDIMYEDDDLMVCNKPPFMPVHPSAGHPEDTLANAVASHLARKGQCGAFRPINRLDRNTSGLVLCAMNRFSAAAVGKSCEKTYYAVCQGILTQSGTIDAPIGVAAGHTIQRAVVTDGARSVTHYRPLKSGNGHTLIEVKLETGRTHQIRVHFSYIGMPLAGDDMYGGCLEHINRQALHCGEMSFLHPLTGERVQLHANIPDDMQTLCENMLP